jgi:phenylacetate-CoA ligase
MNNLLLSFYDRTPYLFKVMAASAWGYYVRWWRYGPETELLVQEALERETWDANKWRAWQEERLATVLHRAATRIPYYREHWLARRRRGDQASWEYLENWPVLEKESLREIPEAFVAENAKVAHLYQESTSGSTGTPLRLWVSRQALQSWYALAEVRWRRWYGVSRKDRWGILGGKLVTPVSRRRPPFWVWNEALKQLYMSSYHLAPDLIPAYLEALLRHRITYLYGYSSSLYALAQEILFTQRRDLAMQVVITNAEPLYGYQREVISQAFQCPVRETYGMSEKVVAAGECEAGGLHLWPEVGIVEILHNNEPVALTTPGDLVCTSLLNTDMPLIRYRVGDRATLPQQTFSCSCGRTLPLIEAVEGREDDLLHTADGRSIGRLDPVFKANFPIREAQIIQESLHRIILRFVPAPEFSAAVGYSIVEHLRARMGSVEVILEPVCEIPRGANGKFRAVICTVKSEGKSTFLPKDYKLRRYA